MKKLKFKTISKQQLSDTITPVGMYSKIRDKYANSLLLEGSDYHSKEESFTFICAEPIVTLMADKNKFTYSYKDEKLDVREIDRDFYSIFEDYKSTVDVDCDEELKAFNGFYQSGVFRVFLQGLLPYSLCFIVLSQSPKYFS